MLDPSNWGGVRSLLLSSDPNLGVWRAISCELFRDCISSFVNLEVESRLDVSRERTSEEYARASSEKRRVSSASDGGAESVGIKLHVYSFGSHVVLTYLVCGVYRFVLRVSGPSVIVSVRDLFLVVCYN